MKAIDGTLHNFQVTGNSGGGEKTITTSERQCSCPPCRQDPTNIETCRYKEERGEIKVHKVRDLDDIERENLILDPHGIRALTIKDLKDELKARYLPISGNKKVLMQRLTECLEQDDTVIEYDEISSEEQAWDSNDIHT